MNLYIILVELNPDYAEKGEGGPGCSRELILHRFLDYRVQGALGHRGKIRDSKLIEGGETCSISSKPLTG